MAGGLGIALTLASLGAQAFGAAQSANANNALRSKLIQKSDSLDNVFNKEYNMDYMATPGVKNEMAAYGNALKTVNKNAEGRAVMAGSSPETVIAGQESANQNLGDFTRKVASGADAYRAEKERNYMVRRDSLDNMILANDQQRASQWTNMMSNAANLGVAGIAADSIQKPDDGSGSGTGGVLNGWFAKSRTNKSINANPGSSMNGALKKNLKSW